MLQSKPFWLVLSTLQLNVPLGDTVATLISEHRAGRIEDKLDRLTETVQKLVLIDERQIEQGKRVKALEEELSSVKVAHVALQRRVDKWLYLATGAWAVVCTGFTIWQSFRLGN